MGWGRWWERRRKAAPFVSHWGPGQRKQNRMPPLCLDPPQGFPTSLQSTLPGKQAPKGRFSHRRFPGCCFQDHPLWPNEGSRTGQREKSGWDAAVTKASAGPQLGWSLKGVWALYSLPPHTHTHTRQPTNQYGMWAAPEQRVGLWA